MGLERIVKYSVFARFVWRLARPIAVVMAQSTKTDVDDNLVTAVDEMLSQDLTDLEE